MKLHTNGALILVRLGKVSLRHTETMIPRGRVDEITKEPKRFEKGHCRPCRGLGPSPQISGHQNRLLIWRELWSAPIGESVRPENRLVDWAQGEKYALPPRVVHLRCVR